MAASSEIDLVCFDLGGVVLRICRSWEEGCRVAGVALRGMDDRHRTADMRKEIVRDYQTGVIDCDTFAHRVSDALDGVYTPEEVMAVHRAWTLDEYPGVEDVIESIHESGLRTACLSNTNQSHWVAIEGYPAISKLQTRLASHLLGLHKPDPEIYRTAERELGVQPSRIVFFDDLVENVDAARAAGWRAHQIDHAGDTAAQIRGHLVPYLNG